MGKIFNTTPGDIVVATKVGTFRLPANKPSVDLAPERIAEIEAAGAVYFSAGELVIEKAATEEKAKAAAKTAEKK